jgi:hypothetical protein
MEVKCIVGSKMLRDYIIVLISPHYNAFHIIDTRRDDVYIG